MIERAATSLILEDARYFPVISIIGPRQVGKTTLAKSLRPQLGKESMYFDLELDEDARLLEQPTRFFQQHADKCIIIDEVQRKPELFPLLRALVDQQREAARFMLLGSASPWLVRHTSESLAGRIAYTELSPFALSELPLDIPQTTHWFRGGFPDALLAPSDEICGRWLENLLKTFIERDVRLLGYELAPATLSRLMLMLVSVHGNLLNMSDLSRSIGVSQPTVRQYIDILEGAFLVDRLQPYFINITKRLVKSPKIYLRDSGILHRLAAIHSASQLQTHILAGASWEGYVIEQIKRATFQRWQYYFYRTQKGAEADLVLISPSGKKALIEIKLNSAPRISRGFFEAKADIKPDRSYLIIPDGHQYQRDDDIYQITLSHFLRQELPVLQ